MKNREKSRPRPKIGLALSGGSGKAIAHVGVLEALSQRGISIDFITACSSAFIVAGSYACGTMSELKRDWLKMDKNFLFHLFKLNSSGKGILNMDNAMEWAKTYMNKNFEDVRPQLGFTCVDVLTGEPVLLTLGSMLKAGLASCAVPGLIEPVPWGSRLLVDGGLYSIVPTTQAREMGADIVIGVDIASTRYMFTRKIYRMREGYTLLRNSLPVKIYVKIHGYLDKFFTRSLNYIFYNQSDLLEEVELEEPGLLGILGRAIDISTNQRRKFHGVIPDCDVLISPKVKHVGKIDLRSAAGMVAEGRRAAEDALPEIEKVIKGWEWKNSNGQ